MITAKLDAANTKAIIIVSTNKNRSAPRLVWRNEPLSPIVLPISPDVLWSRTSAMRRRLEPI
jgi:hypothetical protein